VSLHEEALGRGLGKILGPPVRWMGGRSPATRLPPVDRTGGTHFSKISKTASFFEFNFFKPFFKKFVFPVAPALIHHHIIVKSKFKPTSTGPMELMDHIRVPAHETSSPIREKPST
jgi:hypothetical protein